MSCHIMTMNTCFSFDSSKLNLLRSGHDHDGVLLAPRRIFSKKLEDDIPRYPTLSAMFQDIDTSIRDVGGVGLEHPWANFDFSTHF